ncbi:MAG: DNA-directed RNA polymerase subunit D, partial [Promethearchaeota archaeon]
MPDTKNTGDIALKIKILSKSDLRMSFLVDGIDTELANALRRVILTEVPAMAITEVLFIENSTPLYDEIIAHRLGMIPLTTDLDSYVLPERCTCDGVGCSKCKCEFQCSVHATDTIKNVFSSDLISTDPEIRPVSPKILITKMAKDSRLIFEAEARLGQGKDHAKFQPVSMVSYKMYPNIEIDDSKFKNYKYIGDNENDPIVKMCPKKILRWEGKKLKVTDLEKCTLCGACEHLDTTPP